MFKICSMKYLFCLFAALSISAAVFAQTPKQIVSNMEKKVDSLSRKGIAMTIEIKVPVLGAFSSRTYVLGKKGYWETTVKGTKVMVWADEESVWAYNSETNEVEIRKNDGKPKAESGDMELFSKATDGYDIYIKEETGEAWQMECKKSRNNADKDAPKTIDLIVAKGSFLPLVLRTKMSGITITMKDISFGVPEKKVTFNINDFPGAKINDKR